MTAVPAPPRDLQCNVLVLPAGTELHRIHSKDYRADEFNPGSGSSRFAPFESAGSSVPTMYAATSFGCAAYESIFHDIDPGASFKTVPLSDVERRAGSRIEFDRDMRLARLFEPDLNKWGITRQSLIDTPPSRYPETRLWAQAIHEADPSLDGMIWTSRRFDEDRCLILFGTRVDPSSIIVRASDHLATSPTLLDELVELGRLSDITITM